MKKRIVSLLLAFALAMSMTACGSQNNADKTDVVQSEVQEHTASTSVEVEIEGASYIQLSDNGIMVDGEEADSNSKEAVYVANDVIYYEDGKDFTYGEGEE